MTDVSARVRAQIEIWAQELIDLSRRNKSLYYKPTKNGSVEVLRPSCVDLYDRINAGQRLPVFVPPLRGDLDEPWTAADSLREAHPSALVSDRTAGADVRRALRSLFRVANEDFLDRGVQTLYATFGMLRWRESEDDDEILTPLVFVPVVFEREGASDVYEVVRSDEDAVLNPALQVKLDTDFGIALTGDDLDPQQTDDLGTVLDGVRRRVSAKGWTVEERVVIKRATFQKEAMYRDLLDNAEVIAENELVQSLAGLQTVAGTPEHLDARVPSEAELDEARPPEDALLILDADASQRRAIEAARRGLSFVMDGPPGTGKSQTIANMIAELLGEGKTVLFVSEKAAALEVVQKRLQRVGLDPFLLELHSHKASRRAVVNELSAAVQSRPKAKPVLSEDERRQARRLRGTLGEYAAAVNEVRQPLGRSVAWVAGRLGQLHEMPRLPPMDRGGELTADEAADLIAQATALAGAWKPVVDPGFAWHGFSSSSFPPAERDETARELRGLDAALSDIHESSDALATSLGLRTPVSVRDARHLERLAQHAAARPEAPNAWFTVSPRDARERLVQRQQGQAEWRESIEVLAEQVGDRWSELPHEPCLGIGLDELAAAEPSVRVDAARSDDLTATLQAAREVRRAIGDSAGIVDDVVDTLGVGARDRALGDVLDLLDVASRLDAPVRTEPEWAVPSVLERVRAAVTLLEPLTESYRESAEAIDSTFVPEVLDADLQTLVTRVEENRGLKRLGRVYRETKKELAPLARSGKLTKSVREELPKALEAQRSREALDAAETQHSDVLGRHYQARATDAETIREALSLLGFAIERLGEDYNAEQVGRSFAGVTDSDPLLARRAAEAAKRLRESVAALTSLLPGAAFESVQTTALIRALDMIDRLLPAMIDELVALEALRGTAPLEQQRELLERRAAVWAIEDEWERTQGADAALLGQAFHGLDTDFSVVEEQVEWLGALWELWERHGHIDQAAADRLGACAGAGQLTAELRAYDDVASRLLKRVTAAPRDHLEATLDDDIAEARDTVLEMLDRLDEPEILVRYHQTVASLRAGGLGPAVDRAIDDRVPATELSEALEAAMYSGWIEAQLASGVLAQLDRSRHDEIVRNYQDLDRRILRDAAERLVLQCNERRPTSTIGAAATIQREAAKQRRHKPVRQLLAETVDLVVALKPCFMMSPLSVSQYLPSDFRFDVVIFDEASQITPSDAINCIYRGDQLIVAGDENQLPPTSFFATGQVDDDDSWVEEGFDDFESVLSLAKGADRVESLPLKWHYRSAHESLITFSNYQFYGGQLVTYPSADQEGPDLGVELRTVDGVYRRGGRRDNAVEAAEVARRVEFHAREHPDLSLGVVAFSKAQADAVEDAIDQLRRDQPDLEDYFAESRLDGFFVKNLENVQGDERDIVIFTIGYGPDENGKMTNNFGPINRDGGWRRLNVAVTRARRRVEVVNSFDPASLDTSGSSSRGLHELGRYLDYAGRGVSALAVDLSLSEGDVESPLEESIFRTIRSWGYDVVPQVGTAGYRVDLGIKDPERPGRYLLGVEADGAAYHSSRVARDRDRLRQEVLERLDWRLHRIWGPSWYRNRAAEEERLKQAIEAAIAGHHVVRDTRYSEEYVERDEELLDLTAPPDWTMPYEVAELTGAGLGRAEDDVARLSRQVAEIVAVEAPVHLDVIGRRVVDHHGHSLTKRTREALRVAVATLARGGTVELLGDFVSAGGETVVRVPTTDERSQRKIDHIPHAEIDLAVASHLEAARVATRAELLDAVKLLFGFARMGHKIEAALTGSLERLSDAGIVAGRDGDRLSFVGDAQQ